MKTNKVKTALNSILFASLLTGGMTFLTGCLVGPTESPAVQVADPSAEVAAQISESVSNSALAMTEGLLGSMTFNQFSSVLNGTLFSGNQTFTATVVSDSDEANFRENARTVLLALLQRRADLDTSDTQALAPSNDFGNLVASGNAFYACMEFTSHLLFRVRFTDEHSGELKGYYDQAELVSILFAPHQMTGKIDTAIAQNFLAGLKTVFSAYSIDTGLPSLPHRGFFRQRCLA